MKTLVTFMFASFSALANASTLEAALPLGSYALLNCQSPTILGDLEAPWVLPSAPRRTAKLTVDVNKSRVVLEGKFSLPAFALPGGETVDSRDVVLRSANLSNVEVIGTTFLLVGEGTYTVTSEGMTTPQTLDVLSLQVGENGMSLVKLADAEGADVFSLVLSCRVQNQELLRRLSGNVPR